MLFRSYLDESTEDTKRVFTVGGFAGQNQQWENLEPEWMTFLEKLRHKGISYFHATDCFAGAKEFEGVYSPEREAILDEVLHMVIKHELCLIGHGVDEDAYKQHAPKPKRNDFGVNRYVAAFEGAILAVCESIGDAAPYGDNTGDVCDFYVEKSDYQVTASEAVQYLKTDERLWYRHRIGKDTYGDKRATPLLQVGDFGAFLANKFLSNVQDGRIPWTRYYKKLLEASRAWPIKMWGVQIVWLFVVVFRACLSLRMMSSSFSVSFSA